MYAGERGGGASKHVFQLATAAAKTSASLSPGSSATARCPRRTLVGPLVPNFGHGALRCVASAGRSSGEVVSSTSTEEAAATGGQEHPTLGCHGAGTIL
jgi:hypothetical protein